MTEAYILLNVNCTDQQRIIEEAKGISFVIRIKSVEAALLGWECK
jgi:hypothetical protein